MNNSQLNGIQSKILSKIIARKGYNRHWLTELWYGHHEYCGIGLQDFRLEQRLRKIQIMHKLLNHPKHKETHQKHYLMVSNTYRKFQSSIRIPKQ